MQVAVIDESTIRIVGSVVSRDEYQVLKDAIDAVKAKKLTALTLQLCQNTFLSSMVVGMVVRLVMIDDVSLMIEYESEDIRAFFEAIGLKDKISFKKTDQLCCL